MSKEIQLSDANFNQSIADAKLPVIVDFWAPWCAPCRFVGPILSELAEEKPDKLLVGKLNVDENPMVAGQYGVSAIPTMLVFKDGEMVDRLVGAMPKPMLEAALGKHIDL